MVTQVCGLLLLTDLCNPVTTYSTTTIHFVKKEERGTCEGAAVNLWGYEEVSKGFQPCASQRLNYYYLTNLRERDPIKCNLKNLI